MFRRCCIYSAHQFSLSILKEFTSLISRTHAQANGKCAFSALSVVISLLRHIALESGNKQSEGWAKISFAQQKPYRRCVITLGPLEDYSLTFFKRAVDFFFCFFLSVCACARAHRNQRRTDGVEFRRDVCTRRGIFQQSEKH